MTPDAGSVWEHFGGERCRIACVDREFVTLVEYPQPWPLAEFLREWKEWS